MKFADEHYAHLEQAMQTFFKEQKGTVQNWETLYKGYTEQRKLWDLFWAMKYTETHRQQYNEWSQYNDSHIQTALKKAYTKLLC